MRTTSTTTFLASSSPSDLKLTLQELSSPRSVQTHSSTYYENNQEVAGTPKSDGCCSRVFQSPNNQPITYENLNISPGWKISLAETERRILNQWPDYNNSESGRGFQDQAVFCVSFGNSLAKIVYRKWKSTCSKKTAASGCIEFLYPTMHLRLFTILLLQWKYSFIRNHARRLRTMYHPLAIYYCPCSLPLSWQLQHLYGNSFYGFVRIINYHQTAIQEIVFDR